MAASPPHTDGSVVFAKWRQCATHIQKAKNGCHGNVPQHLWTPSNTSFLGPIRDHNPNGISIGSAVFAHMTTQCPYTLQCDAPFPLKIAPYHGALDPI